MNIISQSVSKIVIISLLISTSGFAGIISGESFVSHNSSQEQTTTTENTTPERTISSKESKSVAEKTTATESEAPTKHQFSGGILKNN